MVREKVYVPRNETIVRVWVCRCRNRRYGDDMTLAADPDSAGNGFAIEDISTGLFAHGFGRLGDGRTFSFQVHHQELCVEIYHPRLAGPVPLPEDVVATSTRGLADIDVDDERSLAAAVRDAVACAQPLPRFAR
jgi:hypothetical protein